MELRERGLSIDAAAREVGVSRTAGRNWANGYRTYRAGQVVGFRPALDRLEVREISDRFVSQDERLAGRFRLPPLPPYVGMRTNLVMLRVCFTGFIAR